MATVKKTRKRKSASPPVQPTCTYSDDDWKARDDARTLASAAAIKKDSDRMKKASTAAKKMLVEEQKSAVEQKARVAEISRLANMQPKVKA